MKEKEKEEEGRKKERTKERSKEEEDEEEEEKKERNDKRKKKLSKIDKNKTSFSSNLLFLLIVGYFQMSLRKMAVARCAALKIHVILIFRQIFKIFILSSISIFILK